MTEIGGVLGLAERRMIWLERRQEVLAQNVANANTPGFRPRDLEAPGGRPAPAPSRTHPGHQGPTPGQPQVKLEPRAETSPDGNGVALDRELARLAETELEHGFATGLHRRFATMLRAALGR